MSDDETEKAIADALEDINLVLDSRKDIFADVQKILDRFNTEIKPNNVHNFQASLDRLIKLQNDFEAARDELRKLNRQVPEKSRINYDKSQSAFNDLVHTAQTIYYSNLKKAQATSAPQTGAPPSSTAGKSSMIKYPKLELPKFSGKIKEWTPFYNLFTTAIDQTDIPGAQKFAFLISKLEGEALQLVGTLSGNDEDYTTAWELICARYNNPRRLVSHHFNGMIDLPELNSNSVLPGFLAQLQEHTHALTALKYADTTYGPLLVTVILRKLSPYFRRRFEDARATASTEYPKLAEITKFLKEECARLDDEAPKKKSEITHKSQQGKSGNRVFLAASKSPPRSNDQASGNNKKRECFLCNQAHGLRQCSIFLSKTPQEREKIVRSNKRCLNCLGPHPREECTSKYRCKDCQRNHNSLLHRSSETTVPNPARSPPPITAAATGSPGTEVLLATFLARISVASGHTRTLRGILDSAAQRSYVTTRAAQALRIKVQGNPTPISGISSISAKTRGEIDINISTLAGEKFREEHTVGVLDSITPPLPTNRISLTFYEMTRDFQLADPQFHLPGPIDLLIGADLVGFCITGPPHIFSQDLPVVMPTIFGDVILGKAPEVSNVPSLPRAAPVTLLTVDCLQESLQRFWVSEEPPQKNRITEEDQLAEKLYLEGVSQDPTGKYIVSLPLKPDHHPLGDSYNQAFRRFQSMERTLQKNPNLKNQYIAFMQDYLDSGHMVLAQDQKSREGFFLPHHPVIKEGSSTTKLRVVFDASAKGSNGISLNDIQLTGPKLQLEIPTIISNFRKYPIVFSCDIKQMYRQILLSDAHHDYQLILWRFNPTDPIQIYKLVTVTFGLTSSPFLAIRTLQQLVKDHGHKYPRAAKILLEGIYVDDIMYGAQTWEEALQIRQELIDLLHCGRFQLRKWTSNSEKFLETIPADHMELPISWDDSNTSAFALLGLQWLWKEDAFSYAIKDTPRPFTKRGALSGIATIFDPCSWLAPVVFTAKTFLQELWLLQLSWDTPLPKDHREFWANFLAELPSLERIRLPRLILGSYQPLQIHGFCDASQKGFAAVVYLRSTQQDGKVHVSLLQAKTKVAPLKRVTIPRLELCAATLLTTLLHATLPNLQKTYDIESIRLWSDSTITLSWIQTPSHRLNTFIGNRVSFIQEAIPSAIWSHLPSSHNPADHASRGIRPTQLEGLTQWWFGPEWLSQHPSKWPESRLPEPNSNLPELKDKLAAVLMVGVKSALDILMRMERYSTWTSLQRNAAYALRYAHNLRHPKELQTTPLGFQDLQAARDFIIRKLQQASFSEDLERLARNKNPSSGLLKLKAFIDEKGILRVGGRLQQSQLPASARQPILLPKRSHITTLIIQHYHIVGLHAGPQLTQSLIQRQYWILSARQVIRHEIFKCITCFRVKPRNRNPLMGELPPARVNPARPFLHCGMDLCGSFQVKVHIIRTTRIVPYYICVFVCMVSKAVHLETVENLTTEAFLSALTRLASRRGWPTDLYSDCGKNFIGAENSFSKARADSVPILPVELQKITTEKGLTFHFNAPSSPEQGGLWEAAVKSLKHHLKRTVGDQVLLLSQFQTLVTQVEALLNSRPLTPLSTDPNELDALTPGHFLIGGPIVAPAEPLFSAPETTPLKRWQQVQELTARIWKRWSQEYLHLLQSRAKWTTSSDNLQIGQLALIHDPNSPPLRWRLGRVIETFPGKDDPKPDSNESVLSC